MADGPVVLDPHERRSLALARLMASRGAWQSALAPTAVGAGAGMGAASLSAGLWLCMAKGRHWLRAVGAEPLFHELREQLAPWIRQRPATAMAIAAVLGAGFVSARPWAHAWLWRTLSQLPWSRWVAEAAAYEPGPPPA